MGLKSAARAKVFRERTANLSTRISARGYGFPDSWPRIAELDGSVQDQLAELCRTALVVAQAMLDAPDEKARETALCQLNQLRGKIGLWKQRLGEPGYWDTPSAFLTLARLRLPDDVFQALMDETRAIREGEVLESVEMLDQAMRATRDALDQLKPPAGEEPTDG